MPKVVSQSSHAPTTPLLGIRHRPGRLALLLFRMPLQAYHHGKGWLLGHTFLLLTHLGRRSGQSHETTLMVLRYRPEPLEIVVCSAWGTESDWVKNIEARPAARVDIGHDSFEPEHRFLSADEGFGVIGECMRRHPRRFRLMGWVLGWGDLRAEPVAREFVRTRPFVSFGPATLPEEYL
jgi:deazaflavin-dependent oxidoreductase (nitroreductase family)